MEQLLYILWFFAPASVANMAPVLANNIPIIKNFAGRIDGGKTYRGKRILGDNKTYRGFIAGVLAGALVGLLQVWLYGLLTSSDASFGSSVFQLSDVDYSSYMVVGMGAAMGFGALFGDAVASFFKRQRGVQPGRSWVPFDQIDFVVGGIVLSLPFAVLSFGMYVGILLVMSLLHPIVNLLGWWFGLKNKPF